MGSMSNEKEEEGEWMDFLEVLFNVGGSWLDFIWVQMRE